MQFICVNAKGQATIHQRIRGAAHIEEGNMLAFDLDSNDRIAIEHINKTADLVLSVLQKTLSEWNSPRDRVCGVIFKVFYLAAVPFIDGS